VLSDPAIYEFENEPPESEEWLTERYRVLERRVSPDGAERWLNWVVRLPDGELAGYVQATIDPSGAASVAYELNSHYWRQGIGSAAVDAMLVELEAVYSVRVFVAVLKRRNFRSVALLRRLRFARAAKSEAAAFGAQSDEMVMVRAASSGAQFK